MLAVFFYDEGDSEADPIYFLFAGLQDFNLMNFMTYL